MCWGSGYLITKHTSTITLPLSYTKEYAVIGVTFWLDSIAYHGISEKTLSTFTTTSTVRSCATDAWLTIGI